MLATLESVEHGGRFSPWLRNFSSDSVWKSLIWTHAQPRGTVVVEVGVHLATQIIGAARRGFSCHAVEASPRSCKLVKDQLLWWCGNHTAQGCVMPKVHCRAASQHSGRSVTFNILKQKGAPSTGDFVGELTAGKKGIKYAQVRVETLALDELLEAQEASPIFVLKIDTQGHEPAVFAGLSRTLARRGVQFILTEFDKSLGLMRNRSSCDSILQSLDAAGYRLCST